MQDCRNQNTPASLAARPAPRRSPRARSLPNHRKEALAAMRRNLPPARPHDLSAENDFEAGLHGILAIRTSAGGPRYWFWKRATLTGIGPQVPPELAYLTGRCDYLASGLILATRPNRPRRQLFDSPTLNRFTLVVTGNGKSHIPHTATAIMADHHDVLDLQHLDRKL